MFKDIFNKNKFLFYKKNKSVFTGFTLLEILVAIGIFMMLSSIFTVIYVTISKNQHQAKASQLLLNNSLYVLEMVAREIKNNELDYNFMGAGKVCSTQNCAVFRRLDGSLVGFSQVVTAHPDDIWYGVWTCSAYPDTDSCDVLEEDRVELLSPNLNNVKVDYLDFVLSPQIDPYLDPVGTSSPKVTIVLKTSYSGDMTSEEISYILQTTVSSRIYKP